MRARTLAPVAPRTRYVLRTTDPELYILVPANPARAVGWAVEMTGGRPFTIPSPLTHAATEEARDRARRMGHDLYRPERVYVLNAPDATGARPEEIQP